MFVHYLHISMGILLNFSEIDWLDQVTALFFIDIYGRTMAPDATCPWKSEWITWRMDRQYASDNREGFGSTTPRQLGLAQQNG